MTSPCETCALRRFGACAKLIGDPVDEFAVSQRISGSASRQRYLQRPSTPSSTVMIIRKGWAASVAHSPDGKRQVFEILLPGDPVGGAVLSGGVVWRSVQALTDVEYCAFDVHFIKYLMSQREDIRQHVVDVTYQLLMSVQERMFDMASRDAEGKILKFILDLYDRLERLGLANGGVCEFPLRQKTIAEAVGLTDVHVNRIMSSLRSRKVLWVEDRMLYVPNAEQARKLVA